MAGSNGPLSLSFTTHVVATPGVLATKAQKEANSTKLKHSRQAEDGNKETASWSKRGRGGVSRGGRHRGSRGRAGGGGSSSIITRY